MKKEKIIKGVLFNLKADEPNANGIIYSKDILGKAIKKYNENYVKNGRALGELGRPKNTMPDVHNIAFKVNEIEFEDDHWNAEIEILNLPKGKLLQELIEHNEYRMVTMGVGEISKDEDGNNVVKEMKITGVGIVPKDNCA